MKYFAKFVCLLAVTLLLSLGYGLGVPQVFQSARSQSAAGFVDIQLLSSSIQTDIRYYGDHNFVGQPIDGYNAPKCLLTEAAARSLAQVQTELEQAAYSLTVYDCYRPQRAVDHFVAWAQDLDDTLMKAEFYPHVEKQNLFVEGYIAERSGHSRGSTIDLTINGMDMGSPYDFFDARSHTISDDITDAQQRNRLLLKNCMERNGFRNYSGEWWHYTLENEPFPNTYFDFPID